MAVTSIYVQLKGGRPPRLISATSLTWFFGRATTLTVMYQSTAGTAVKIETFIHRQESTPEPSAGAFTVVPATDPSKTITVAQEQVAVENSQETNGTLEVGSVQFAPPVLNTSAEVTTMTLTAGRNLKSPARIQRIIGESVFDYIRFTGTELPTGGIIIARSDFVGMFSAETAPTDL